MRVQGNASPAAVTVESYWPMPGYAEIRLHENIKDITPTGVENPTPLFKYDEYVIHVKEKDAASKAASVIDKLKEQADAVITVSRQCLWEINGQDTSIEEAVRAADNIFYQIVKGIGDIIGQSGSVNLDFADVKSILANSGTAFIGFGEAAGEKASLAAVKAAIESPLLKGLKGARAILMNIVGSSRSIGGMVEVNEATTAIQELAHQDAEIIWGVTTDEAMGEKASVIVIATKLAEDSDEVEV